MENDYDKGVRSFCMRVLLNKGSGDARCEVNIISSWIQAEIECSCQRRTWNNEFYPDMFSWQEYI